ncbi:hypothetical protein DV737_g2429, partial [Chaetothyriales sp. CBS 132003]
MTLSRQQAFQQLRPPCVALSSVALRFKGHQAPVKDVLHALQDGSNALTLLGEQNALDEKLAEYAFFPLTHIFNEAQRLSSSCLEVAIKCVIVLVTKGWRHHLSPDLAKQLLILMTLVTVPDSAKEASPEEVKVAALECIDAIVLQLSGRPDSRHLFNDIGTKKLVDQMVYMMLDTISESESEQIQIAAAEALLHLLAVVSNRVMLASVLPSTASALTKVLKKSPSARRTRKVLVSYLRVLKSILHSVLADAVVYPLEDGPSDASGTLGEDQKTALGTSWLRATAPQVKLILLQVTKLRGHESSDVRRALADLCFMIAKDCATSLSDSTSVVVETLLYIGSLEEEKGISLELEQLAISDSRIADVIRTNFDRSSSDMLVDNVDYLINAVALKLNSFDVSPQAPQVVLMMLRLCGARIVPYLDDTVESIFSALNNFHGYPRLVELLFQVLKGVVQESKEQSDLTITNASAARDHTTTDRRIFQISDIVNDLRRRKSRKRDFEEDGDLQPAPHRPWREQAKEQADEQPPSGIQDDNQDDMSEGMGASDPGPKDDDPLKSYEASSVKARDRVQQLEDLVIQMVDAARSVKTDLSRTPLPTTATGKDHVTPGDGRLEQNGKYVG